MRIFFVLLVLANLALFAAGQGYFGPPPSERGRDPARLLTELNPEGIRVPRDQQQTSADATQDAAQTPPDAEAVPAIASEPALAPRTTDAFPSSDPPPAANSAEPSPESAPAADHEASTNPAPLVPAPAPVPSTVAPAVSTVCREWGSFTEAELAQARQWARRQWPDLNSQTRTEPGPASWMVLVPPAANLAAAKKTAAALNRQGIKDLFVIQEAGPQQYAISLGVFSQEKSARSLAQSLQGKAGRTLQVTPRTGPPRHWLQFPQLDTARQQTVRQEALKQQAREWRACKGA